ncbi:MAG: ABC-F family ATP-binding cassette domain-containing protein [Firmicutes bacterium]|nr:ABC-F family ATP-binding cassette domain-containing protein [Bacillota bacterium]
MIEINLNKIVKSYGFNRVLDELSLEVKTGEIITFIGENGCGKSTLLNIINGDETLDSGNISIRKGNTIGYLKQEAEIRNDNEKVLDILYESVKDILEISNKLKDYEEKMINAKPKELNELVIKYSNLQEKFINIGGYEIDTKINKIISGFKLNDLINKNYNTLSGGEKRIVSLAAIMIKEPSILLLDEPTNHLDIETLEWFENFIKKYKGTILLVSHDRYFIDKVSTKIVLLERGKEIIFNGNYSYYLKENDLRIELEFKEYKDQSKIIEAMKKKIKQLEEFGRLAYPGGDPFFRRAENIRKRLDRLEKVDKPIVKKDIPINFNINERSGKDVITINNYDLSINDNILIENINIKINYNDKICIMGSNGCGKSTLIKRILENNSNIKIGSNVTIGYIPQDIEFNSDKTILEYARQYFIGEESHLRSALNKFYFHGENVFKKIKKLSGGEKVRLKLFELIQCNNNCIILDEPTNHIDIATKELLETALKEFKGTVIFISHDRYFINKLANKILYIENKKIKEYIGNYDDYKYMFESEKKI